MGFHGFISNPIATNLIIGKCYFVQIKAISKKENMTMLIQTEIYKI